MKGSSTPIGQRLIAELRVLRDIVFEDRCRDSSDGVPDAYCYPRAQ